ncbi:hypothetical protein LWC34_41960 [Kibdelosporangium philippinense]|uniref:Uncharacterized protein n=1 Tax=Kibdelosporangium philippinense TaxID=211113 RepID=A0ABS8ZNK5_9PSEU|nr:hypothetical protein [Kibdelosporangium philippinense]MCE7009336.1 hypothetical protein [Kibdelosporangium philippinense]
MNLTDPFVIGLAVLALVGLLALRRTGKNKAATAALQVREVTRMGGTFVRTLFISGVIVAVQAAVWTFSTDTTARVVALAVPALLAGVTVARLFAVTTVVHTKKGGHR